MNLANSAGSAVGQRLLRAREAAGLTVAQVAARARLPARSIEAIESGDWEALGPSVFARGQVRSYARELGITVEGGMLTETIGAVQPEPLVSRVHVPRYRHLAEHLGRRAVYVVMTVALVVPVWLATRSGDGIDGPEVAPLDVAPGTSSWVEPEAPRAPVVASMAPIGAGAARAPVVAMELRGDSWVQLFDADGVVVEKGLLRAGERRELRAGGVARVVLGNAHAVELRANGQPVDLAPFTRANVARFALSSDGSLAPIAP